MEIVNVNSDIKAILKTPQKILVDPLFNNDVISKVRNFHRSMEQYRATPLVELKCMALELGVKNIYVKDESYRFGLKAFKVMGGIYGLANVLADYLGLNVEDVNFDYFKKPQISEKLKDITIISATDGNHGRGLAWAGAQLGCKVVIYMPKGSTQKRAEAIQSLGAEVHITEYNYDDTLRVVIEKAKETEGSLHVQDTAWEGYTEIPNWITQGYMTIADEALTQLSYQGVQRPTHIFLQAGAGSFAMGIAGYFATIFGENCPKIIIVEPENASCYYASIMGGKEEPVRVVGDLDTIMAGLSVGEVSIEAWKRIPQIACGYISCKDFMSSKGTRLLAVPVGDDPKVVSGESGSVCMGVLHYIMNNDSCQELREKIDLGSNSNILLFSTEGDTDPDLYKQIVYNGYCKSK
ncbi:diaminopropionate ammonia-lyase [Crassaminicella profunda]|uniref:diaminopropionate ammonia-lyase n=1 Tax=Crassaminicella profunda TaxID=1286698 RepID=UPI001CA701FC|nr:diaminopropionate ammonia-lyase [Crassaminicella profunda]QZY54819.1 diaminopropionate ammonia-lyase [Crassaminicella profunda]